MIPLNCAGCGAKLEIEPDMDVFACGYCGLNQKVERKGGTVSLKRIGDAIARVQQGTDKTAAELALQRLKQELAAAEAERVRIMAGSGQRKTVLSRRMGPYLLGAFALAIATLIAALNSDNGAWGLACFVFVVAMFLLHSAGQVPAPLLPANQAAANKVAAILRQMEKQRGILDS